MGEFHEQELLFEYHPFLWPLGMEDVDALMEIGTGDVVLASQVNPNLVRLGIGFADVLAEWFEHHPATQLHDFAEHQFTVLFPLCGTASIIRWPSSSSQEKRIDSLHSGHCP
jgi:hypothetical protein